jgi:glucose/arabinose dehydrogenase
MRGVATAPDGSVLAVDFGPSGGPAADGRVIRLNTTDGSSTLVAAEGSLANPSGIAVAEDGTIFVTNVDGAGHGQIVEIDPSNGAQSVVAAAPLVVPWGIAVLPDGDLVVADANYNGAFRDGQPSVSAPTSRRPSGAASTPSR